MGEFLQRALIVSIFAAAPLVAEAAPPKKPGPPGDMNSVRGWTRTFLGYYEKTFPKLPIDDTLCQGDVPASREAEATELLGRINGALATTKSSSKRVMASDKKVPWIAERLAWRQYAADCAAAIVGQRKAAKDAEAAGKAQVKERYWAFITATKDVSRTVRETVGRGAIASTQDPGTITRFKNDLDSIDTLCKGEFKGIKNDPRYGMSDDRNPETICKVAATGDEYVKTLALKAASDGAKRMAKDMSEQASSLSADNGYIKLDGNIQKRAIFTPDEVKAEISDRYTAVLAAAGVRQPDTMWADFDTGRTALWAAINANGKSWKAPKKDGNDLSAVKAAKKTFGIKGTKVVKAYTTRSSWNIVKNRLGIPLRRTKPGYALMKVKSDKALAGSLCRGRSFTYAEEYDGRRYKKAKTVGELGYIRFENCK